MNPANVDGLAIISGRTLVSVIISRKQDGLSISRGCSVVVPGLGHEDANRLLQSSYRLRFLGETQQVASLTAMYTVDALDLGDRGFAMKVQSNPAGGFSILALFEIPSTGPAAA